MKLRYAHRFVVCALLVSAAVVSKAVAANSNCPENEFGTLRAHVQFIAPAASKQLFERFHSYAKRHGLSHYSMSINDPTRQPSNAMVEQMFSALAQNVVMHITIDKVTNLGEASINTVGCGASESWRPYWRNFMAFLRSQNFKLIRGRR